MKTDLFQSCGHWWVLQICWHIEHSTFTASSFRIWNSSAVILSPPSFLVVVMLPKTHLTSDSKMSGSRWVITLSWLSGSWRSFLYNSVYFCHLLISSASVRSIPFLSFIVLIFAWNVPLVSLIFLKISLVFHLLLFSSISLHWSLRKAFLSLPAIFWNSAFKLFYLSFSPLPFASLLFTAICKASPENHYAFMHFFFLGMILITASFAMSWTSVHSSSVTLVYQIFLESFFVLNFCLSWIYLSLPVYNHEGIWFRSYPNGLVIFPIFFNLSLNLAIRSSWSEPQSSWSCFCCIERLHLWLQRV